MIIVDIDGTVAKMGDRLNYIKQTPKDWNSFYSHCDEDLPVFNIISLVKTLSSSHNIIFCTGRSETIKEKTKQWLEKYFGSSFQYDLLMRKEKDYRPDYIVKPELLKNAGLTPDKVTAILEDRTNVVLSYRALGYTCLQVAEGDY
jgi:hypothetical protein